MASRPDHPLGPAVAVASCGSNCQRAVHGGCVLREDEAIRTVSKWRVAGADTVWWDTALYPCAR